MSVASNRKTRAAWLKECLTWIDSNEWPFMPPRCWQAKRDELELWELRRLARCWMRARLVERQGWGRTITQAVVWPFWSLVKTTRFIRAVGHTVYAGVSPIRSWYHAYRLLMLHNLRLEDQSDITLDASQLITKTRQLMVCRELQAVLGAMHKIAQGWPGIDRKQVFARFCAAHGLPTPEVLSEGAGGRATTLRRWPAADVFFKPSDQGKGQNVECFRHEPVSGGWRDESGAVVTAEGMAVWAQRKIGDEAWLVQERLQNATSWQPLTTGALATCRVVTVRHQPEGEPRVMVIFARFPVASATVDNLSAGGLGAGVDPQSGVMTLGKIWGGGTALHSVHPVTGATIAGAVMPDGEALCDLALRAHRAAGAWTSIGWDVAMTTRGPVLIEANLQSAACFHQTVIEIGLLKLLRERFGDGYLDVLRPHLCPC